MKVMSADISPCLRAVSNVFGDIGADSRDLNLPSTRIVMGVTGTKHASAAGIDPCGPPPPCSPSTAAPVDQLLAISPVSPAAADDDGQSHQLQLCLRTSGIGDAIDCPCVHCGQKSESDGSESCGHDPSDGDRHPSCRTQLPDPDEIRAVQADWSELRQNIRQFYWLYMDAAAATSAHHHSSEQARAAAAQLQPVVQDKVGRLSQRDPHQLFVRLNGQLLELAGEVRSRLLQQLGQRPQPQLPEAFIVQLLEHYDDMVSAAVSLTPALSALQRYHMDRFGLTWQTLNEYAYQSIVYMEPMVANNLPTMLSQVRYAHPTCARSSRLVLRYVDFDDQMTAAAELWGRAEPQLQEYGQELASRRAKHRLLREDWEMLRAQKKLLRQEAGGRPVGEGAAGGASPSSSAAGASLSSSETAGAYPTAESTTRSPADGQFHTQAPPAPPPLPPPAHTHCSSRSCCTKKSTATQVSSSSMTCTSGGGGTSSSHSSGTDSSSSSAGHQPHHSHHTQHKHSASSAVHKHGGGAAICPVGAHGGGKQVADSSCVVGPNPDQWLELGDDLNDSCSEQSSSTASQHCCCCCCELFGHNNGAGQAPVSRNYPEMRDRLRLRLDQRRQRESAGGKCTDGGGSPDQCAGGEGDAVSAGSCGHNHATAAEQLAPAPPPQRDERDLGDLLQYIESDDRQKQERHNEKRAAKRDRQRVKRLEQRASDERRQDQMRSIQEFQRRNPEVTITVVNSANGGPAETPDDRPVSAAAAVSSPPSPLPQPAEPPQPSTPPRSPRQSKDTACEPLSSPQSQPPPAGKKSALLESLSNSADGSTGEGTGDNKMVTIRRVMEPGLGEPKVTITLKGDSPDKDRVLMTLVNGQMRGDEPSRRPQEPEKPMTKTAKKKLKKALKLEKLKEEEEAAERARQEAARAAEEEVRRLRLLEEQKLLEEQRQQQLQQQKKNKKKKKGSGNNGSVQAAAQSQVHTANSRGKAAGKTSGSDDAQVSKSPGVLSSVTGRPQETTASRVQASSARSPAIVESNKLKPQQASPPMTNGVITPRVNGFSAPVAEAVVETKKNKKKKAANNCIAAAAAAVTGNRPVVENGVHPVSLEPPTQLMRDLTLSSDSEIEELARTYRIPAGISITRVPAMPPQLAGRSYSGVAAAPLTAAASSSAPALHDAADDRKSKKKRRKKKTSGEELQLAPDVTIRKVEAGQRPRGAHLDDYESVFMPSAGGVTDSVDQEVEAFKRFCLDGPQVNREHRPKVNLNIKDIFIKMKPS